MDTESIKSFFYYSKGERKGVLLLIFFILITVTAPKVVQMFHPVEESFDPDLSKEVEAFLNQLNDTLLPSSLSSPGFRDQNNQQLTNHQFMGTEAYNTESLNVKKQGKSMQKMFDLNAVDSVNLISLAGIGPVFAHRIIRYRERLGGYVSLNQLNEVYGITSEKFNQIRSYFQLTSMSVKKVDLNNASFKELMKHPYSSYELAKAICRFRSQYGKIDQVDDILKAGVITDSGYRKLQPYLMVQ